MYIKYIRVAKPVIVIFDVITADSYVIGKLFGVIHTELCEFLYVIIASLGFMSTN